MFFNERYIYLCVNGQLVYQPILRNTVKWYEVYEVVAVLGMDNLGMVNSVRFIPSKVNN